MRQGKKNISNKKMTYFIGHLFLDTLLQMCYNGIITEYKRVPWILVLSKKPYPQHMKGKISYVYVYYRTYHTSHEHVNYFSQ